MPQLLKPACLEPMLHNKRSHHKEKPAHRNEKLPPLAATRESPHTATKTQRSQKFKKKKVNGLNAPTKRHRLAEWVQKQDPSIRCLQETQFRSRDTYRLKVRGWKKIFHANGNQKKDGVAILISHKIDFKTKTITRDKEGHYKMIKGSIDRKSVV